MPMPQTLTYQQRVSELHQKAPDVAKLIARIAAAIRPQHLSLSPEELENVLFTHADAIAQQLPSCSTRLTVWLNLLGDNDVRALDHSEVVTFVNEGAILGGPSGVLAS